MLTSPACRFYSVFLSLSAFSAAMCTHNTHGIITRYSSPSFSRVWLTTARFPKGGTKARRRRRSPVRNLQTTRELCGFRRIDYPGEAAFSCFRSNSSLKRASAPPLREDCCHPRLRMWRDPWSLREGMIERWSRQQTGWCQQTSGVRTILPGSIEDNRVCNVPSLWGERTPVRFSVHFPEARLSLLRCLQRGNDRVRANFTAEIVTVRKLLLVTEEMHWCSAVILYSFVCVLCVWLKCAH